MTGGGPSGARAPGGCGWLTLAREGRLVLASSSPRRAELLKLLGVPFAVCPSYVPEDGGGRDPAGRVLRLATAKAIAVAKDHGDGLILGGDTEVVLNGEMLGKPADANDALGMLVRLRGRTHEVLTGLHLIDCPTGLSCSRVERTLVTMRNFSDGEAAAYVEGGEPLDKAGAYGIQGKASVLVSRIEGCFYNVVGLPLSRLAEMMEELWGTMRGERE